MSGCDKDKLEKLSFWATKKTKLIGCDNASVVVVLLIQFLWGGDVNDFPFANSNIWFTLNLIQSYFKS